MRILITGGAGFLGYHLANFCAAQGASIDIVDLVSPDPSDYADGTRFHVADVRDSAAVDRVLQEPGDSDRVDVIVHAAAALPLWKPSDIRETTVDGTRIVIDAARRAGVERVVYISSTAVYGISDKHPSEEEDPLTGIGPYGESKVIAEGVCLTARELWVLCSDLTTEDISGNRRLGVFHLLYEWVNEGRRVPVLGSGHNRYQLLDVEDLCDAIWKAAAAPAAVVNDTFNVGATEYGTVLQDLGALCKHAGTGARVMPVPAWPAQTSLRVLESVHLSPLYRWIYETADKESYVSTTRVEQALGWQPQRSNADSLMQSYDWYVANKHRLSLSTGITHRTAWAQGALNLVRRCF